MGMKFKLSIRMDKPHAHHMDHCYKLCEAAEQRLTRKSMPMFMLQTRKAFYEGKCWKAYGKGIGTREQEMK